MIFSNSLPLSDAKALLNRLGVEYAESTDGGISRLKIVVTPEEGASMVRYDGDRNLSGCCGKLSYFQSIFTGIYLAGDWVSARDLTELYLASGGHEGLELFHPSDDMYGKDQSCQTYMKSLVKCGEFPTSDPWTRFAAVFRICADHLFMGLSHMDLSKHRPDSLYEAGMELSRLAVESAISDHDVVSRKFSMLKMARALYQTAAILETEDLSPKSAFAILDESGEVVTSFNGPALYATKREADVVAELYVSDGVTSAQAQCPTL